MRDAIEDLLRDTGAELMAVRESRKRFDRDLAFDFDPIGDVWGLTEMNSSSLLAYYLRPNGEHGQGRIYLDAFLECIGKSEWFPKDADPNLVQIETEEVIGDLGRLDIVIHLTNPRFLIIIENKIWAGDQESQLARYSCRAKKEALNDYVILYLTPHGSLPSEQSLTGNSEVPNLDAHDEHLVTKSWIDDIIGLLERWEAATRAPIVRYAIEGFRRGIQREIKGGLEMGDEEAVIDRIGESIQSMLAAHAVHCSFEGYKRGLIVDHFRDRLLISLREKLPEYSVTSNIEGSEIYKGIDINHAMWKHLKIGFQFQSASFRNFGYGIAWKTENDNLRNTKKAAEQISALSEKTRLTGKFNPMYWLAYDSFDTKYSDWNERDVLEEIYGFSFGLSGFEESGISRAILEAFERLQEAVSDADAKLQGS